MDVKTYREALAYLQRALKISHDAALSVDTNGGIVATNYLIDRCYYYLKSNVTSQRVSGDFAALFNYLFR